MQPQASQAQCVQYNSPLTGVTKASTLVRRPFAAAAAQGGGPANGWGQSPDPQAMQVAVNGMHAFNGRVRPKHPWDGVRRPALCWRQAPQRTTHCCCCRCRRCCCCRGCKLKWLADCWLLQGDGGSVRQAACMGQAAGGKEIT